MENQTRSVKSADGTQIAFDMRGEGAPIILVDGAFGSRDFGPMPRLAELLAQKLTVLNFDRRGRGESGDGGPYAVEREIEDIDALLEAAGGKAHLYGFSSGAILAFRAAGKLASKVKRLALYEPPLAAPDGRSPLPPDYRPAIEGLLSAGRREEAVDVFFSRAVGMTPAAMTAMRATPAWPKYVEAASTLATDLALQEDSGPGRSLPSHFTEPIVSAGMLMLMLHGDRSPEWLGRAAEAIARAVQGCRLRTLENQTHDVKPGVLAPVLLDFYV